MAKPLTLSHETEALLGITAKEFRVYTTLLQLGTAPLRKIAEESSFARGSTYDALKSLIKVGMVQYVDATSHRYFSALAPQALTGIAHRRELSLREAVVEMEQMIPDLEALMGMSAHRPRVTYMEGEQGIKQLLEDVLTTTQRSGDRTYRIYSSQGIRDQIAHTWPSFTKERIKRGVRVKTLAIGEGGQTFGLDDRKWISKKQSAPSYVFIYPSKTAFVCIDEHKKLFGVLLEDSALSQTQAMVFDSLWVKMS